MKKLLSLLVLCCVAQACNAEYSMDKITINNILDQCIKINKKSIENKNNLLLLHTVWDVKSNIGECGCKSALISYDVHEVKNKKLMFHGVLSSMNKKEFYFVISSDGSIYKEAGYKVSISCSS